jgi:hypothetical protein
MARGASGRVGRAEPDLTGYNVTIDGTVNGDNGLWHRVTVNGTVNGSLRLRGICQHQWDGGQCLLLALLLNLGPTGN